VSFSSRYLCPERRGPVIREVRETEPTFELEIYLRTKLKPVPGPLKDYVMIYDPMSRVFLVDDVGVLIKGPLDYEGLPDVHVGFWDRILAGREQMCYSVAEVVAADAGAPGVFTAIPKDSRATLAFAKRTGFQEICETPTVVVLTLRFEHHVHR
jgi:hypothetical protein